MIQHLLEEPVGIFLVIIAVILIAPLISERLRLPGIVGLILGGVIVGPSGLGWVAREGVIESLAVVGLIYLMFTAGAEIDLHQFNRVRAKSIVYGLLKFVIPQAIGTLIGLLLNYPLLSAILLGAIFASHTLVAFPIASQLGILRHESTAVTVGATIITDILALIVLAAVARVATGAISLWLLIELLGLILLYTALILFAIPRLGRLFFSRFSARDVEFQFVLLVILVAAFLAEAIGIEAIVGAFLAGLAVNATLPHRSMVMARVLFIGESFFIPIFALSIGLLIDLRGFLNDVNTLWIGALLVGGVYLTHYVAAWITGRVYAYGRPEVITMWGLSQAHAGSAIAIVLVGQSLGLFDVTIFNAVIMVILFTCISSPILVRRFGRQLAPLPSTRQDPRLPEFTRVLIPVANPDTEEHLIRLAAILAHHDHGTLMPLHIARVIDTKPDNATLEAQRRLLAAEILHESEVTVQPIHRIDDSIPQGILFAALETDATSLIMGWSGKPSLSENIFGRLVDDILWAANIPVLISRISTSINAKQRVILVIPRQSIKRGVAERILNLAVTIARGINVPLWVLTDEQFLEDLQTYAAKLEHPHQFQSLKNGVIEELRSLVTPQDLILVTTTGSRYRFESSLGRIPEQIAAMTPASLVVIRYPLA